MKSDAATYVIASNRVWNKDIQARLEAEAKGKIVYIDDKNELTLARLKAVRPRYIFFPHWSFIIPREIHDNFECVIFHMTDLPFGRGGSPLQNLISRGIYETKITALKCINELDAGPIYMKEPFALYGSAEEIYLRASRVVENMILRIIETNPVPKEQVGESVNFDRRKPEESDISALISLEQVFDYVRMLDAEGYPKAFIETEYLRFEFQRASLRNGKLIVDATISEKKKEDE